MSEKPTVAATAGTDHQANGSSPAQQAQIEGANAIVDGEAEPQDAIPIQALPPSGLGPGAD